jgi:penicillin-binding protein 1C
VKRWRVTALKFGGLSTGAMAVCAALMLWWSEPPDLTPVGGYSRAVLDRHGALLRLSLAADERYRLYVPLQDIAPAVADATLLYEDRHFRRHVGINPVALVRAAWTTYVTRERPVGASTITMQLARLRYQLDTRSMAGKVRQMGFALWIERHYSKDEILEAYLNLAPYGGNVEGIGAAARIYFDKRAAQLSVAEALTLAVVPQHPRQRHPAYANNKALQAARQRLANQWATRYSLTEAQRAALALPQQVRPSRALPFLAPHFSQRLARQANAPRDPVQTTLDINRQRELEQQVEQHLSRMRERGINNASALLLDARSMDVLASVGSADFFNRALEGQVDGTRAKRSPGSTLKPFLYGLAMDEGLIHPRSLLKDAPVRYAAYAPENFDRGFMGPVSATDALIYSRNVPAINVLARLGHDRFHEFLQRGGVANLRNADHYGLAMILGGNEVTMRELVALYAMLANGGRWQPLRERVEQPRAQGLQLLSAEASFLVLDMLRQNPRPDRSAIAGMLREEQPVAWKTGTSYAFRDAWSVGVVGHYVLAVWVGNFDGSANPALVGREAAAPLFFSIADGLANPRDVAWPEDEPTPELNVRRVEVCAPTGDLPGRHCPRTEPAWFIPGVSPIRVSDVHRAVKIDVRTGLRACAATTDTRTEVYEFWPSDIARVFERAGVAVRRPPPWHGDCPLAAQVTQGRPPEITSPDERLVYQIRPAERSRETLALQATTDSDARWLYWFADGRLIARVARDTPAYWRPALGEHEIAVVDDLGRGQVRQVAVALVQ